MEPQLLPILTDLLNTATIVLVGIVGWWVKRVEAKVDLINGSIRQHDIAIAENKSMMNVHEKNFSILFNKFDVLDGRLDALKENCIAHKEKYHHGG